MKDLVWMFGWFAVLTSIALVFIPYMRGRADLINSWTIFHVGASNFLGIASIQTAYAPLQYGIAAPEDYTRLAMSGFIFYLTLILTYYCFPTNFITNRVWVKVGPRAPRAMVSLVPICILLAMGYLFVPQIQFLGQWMVTFGRSASVFAVVFCFVAWSQRPYNPWLAGITGMTLVFASIAVNTELGRRDFLSVLVTLPLCWYWLRGRYMKPTRALAIAGIFSFIAFLGIEGISMTRFARRNPDMSIIEAAWTKLKAVPDALQAQGTGGENMFGSDCIDASLASIRLYERIQPTEPFFVFKYVLLHPVPRAWWPSKPMGLGYTLPIDIGWVRKNGPITIGPGIIGHCYQEGGMIFIVFYGVIFAVIMRCFDTMLSRDPGNPYLMSILGSCSGHLIGLLRGDVGLFWALMMGIFVTGVLINWISRIIFWTDRIMPEGFVPPESAMEEYQYELGPNPDWQTY